MIVSCETCSIMLPEEDMLSTNGHLHCMDRCAPTKKGGGLYLDSLE